MRRTGRRRAGMMQRFVGYGASRTTVEGLLGLRGIALAGLLGPELFGAWSLFRLGLRYLGVAGQGLFRGLEVEVAGAAAKPARFVGRAQRFWGRVTLGPILCLYGVVAAIAAIAWLWPVGGLAGLALAGVALGIVPDRLWRYALAYLRAAGALRDFAVLELLHAVLHLGVTVAFAVIWGLPGALVGFALASMVALGLMVRQAPWKPLLIAPRAWHLFRIGFPISFSNISTVVLQTVDRLLVGALAGLGALGLYAFAVSLSGLGVSFALVVRNVILTDVYGEKAKGTDKQPGRSTLERSMAVFTTLVPALGGIVALGLPPIVLLLVPQYQPAILLAQIFVFIGILQGVVNVAVLGIVAEGRQGRLPALAIGTILLNVLLTLLALKLGFGLVGVATGALLSRLFYAAAAVSLLTLSRRQESLFGTLAKSLGPTLWCAAAVIAIHLTVPAGILETLIVALPLYILSLIPPAALIRTTLADLRH